MDLFRFFFQDYEIIALLVWIVLTFGMYREGFFNLFFSRLSLISTTCTIGYFFLIIFGILGSGHREGLIFPHFDAFTSPLLLFLLGIPIIMLTILLLYLWHIYQIRKFRFLPFSYLVTSLFVLSSVLEVYLSVLASI